MKKRTGGEKEMAKQQGDVRFVKATMGIPQDAKKLEHLILAKGEVTGYCHQILDGKAELYEKDGTLYLRVLDDEVKVVHEEHKPITLPRGDFIVKRVREYDHFEEEAKIIKD